MSMSEQACTYAVLILHDDGIPVTADKISAIVDAAKLKIEPFWFGLFAKLVQKVGVEDLILNAGSGGGAAPVSVAAPAAGGAAAAPAAPAAEEKKEEPKEESDEDMGFSLFD